MRIPTENRIGLSSTGVTGNLIIAGVIFGFISPWWLILGGLLVLSAVGIEVGKNR